MPKPQRTRAQRREERAGRQTSGIYGVEAYDYGADHRLGRYLCWADNPDEARLRIRDAGFHKKTSWQVFDPESLPTEPPLPSVMTVRFEGWYRSRNNWEGWSAWEPLPADYRHNVKEPD